MEPLTAGSGIGGPAVNRNGLAGDEIAVGGGKEDERAEKVFGIFVTLDGAAHDRRLLRMGQMAWVFVDDAVGERESGCQTVDADVVLTELARNRTGERRHRALRRHVV